MISHDFPSPSYLGLAVHLDHQANAPLQHKFLVRICMVTSAAGTMEDGSHPSSGGKKTRVSEVVLTAVSWQFCRFQQFASNGIVTYTSFNESEEVQGQEMQLIIINCRDIHVTLFSHDYPSSSNNLPKDPFDTAKQLFSMPIHPFPSFQDTIHPTKEWTQKLDPSKRHPSTVKSETGLDPRRLQNKNPIPPKKNTYGFVWKCWVNIPNEIAI